MSADRDSSYLGLPVVVEADGDPAQLLQTLPVRSAATETRPSPHRQHRPVQGWTPDGNIDITSRGPATQNCRWPDKKNLTTK